jgi:toxoflavin biosynthesis protein ToxC
MTIAATTATLTQRRGSFTRHRGPVTCVAGVPGTDLAVTSAYDGAVGLFDLATREVELLGYHDHLVNRVTVDAAGRRAATSSSDYTIRLWDLRGRCLERVLRGHSDDVEDFAFAGPDVGVSVSRDWRVIVWDLTTGAIRRVIDGHERDVLSVVCCNGRIYTSGDDKTLRVWDLESGRLLKMWGPFEHETDSCAVDPLHGRAVLGCDDGVIRVFDIESGATLAEIAAHRSGIKKVATSPITGDILSAAYDQRVLIWDARTFQLKVRLDGRRNTWERSFNWTPNGMRVLAGTFDGTVLVWNAAAGLCLGELGEPGETGPGNACLNDVAADGRGDLATVSDDGYVRLARLTPDQGVWLSETEPASGRLLANAVTLDGLDGASSRVVTGAHDHTLHLFRRHGGRLTDEIEVRLGRGPINCVRIAHHAGYEGEVFVACYGGDIVRVGPEGDVRGVIQVHDGAVKALRLHPELPLGVSCSADGALLSWDFTGSLRERFLGHMAIVDDVDIDPSGRFIASVGRDFTLKVYSLEDGRMLHSVSLGRRSPKGVCFWDPDTVVITNYWGALLRVDLATGRVQTRQIAENGFSAAVRSGEHLVAVSYDGAAYLVRVEDLTVLRTLRRMTQRLEPSPWLAEETETA